MVKIGFIDYFIDEWHANNYPSFIKNTGRNFVVYQAWEFMSKKNGLNLHEWCKVNNVLPAESLEQVVENCDVIMVLAPSNPEVHESLAEFALKSGKPIYIDKPFSNNLSSALSMFEKAEKYNTRVMSSSALRFSEALQNTLYSTHKGITPNFVSTMGGGSSFFEYSIHQFEMIVSLMGLGAKRIIHLGNKKTHHLIIDYHDERRASLTFNPNENFSLLAYYNESDTIKLTKIDDFWNRFISKILDFFDGKINIVSKGETLEIINLFESGNHAVQNTDSWINLH